MGRKKVELVVGQTYKYLTVIEFSPSNCFERPVWICECVCGNVIEVNGLSLLRGETSSCGCIKLERITNLNKKYNIYEFDDENNIGYCFEENKNDKLYSVFDIEDFDLIKTYYWTMENGYWRSHTNKSQVSMHQVIMWNGEIEKDDGSPIDHENRKRNDNRKSNLRFCTTVENSRNRSIQNNNISGIVGVNERYENGWRAYITDNGKQMTLGVHRTFEDAVFARLLAEKELFGEFAPQRHLFEQYGII